jgi:hypothetical protein
MADFSKGPRLRQIVDLHLETCPNYVGRRLVDEKATFRGDRLARWPWEAAERDAAPDHDGR